jgi:peptide-methionine (R)-S-oxide reductase
MSRFSLLLIVLWNLARFGSAYHLRLHGSYQIVPLSFKPRMLCQERFSQKQRSSFMFSEKNSNSDLTTNNEDDMIDLKRRRIWTKTVVQVASVAVGLSSLVALTRPVWASNKSRTTGYPIQKSEEEWKAMLSPMQYFVLRQGGTERPGFSVLEKEKRAGIFKCAGCGTPLFRSEDKFNSGTGWPSFARGQPGVEIESLNPFASSFSGAELRCKTCGGHLGDVFQDGFLFQGTEAAVTGQRFCIDGAALVFYQSSAESEDASVLRGDIPARNGTPTMPSFLESPPITPRD